MILHSNIKKKKRSFFHLKFYINMYKYSFEKQIFDPYERYIRYEILLSRTEYLVNAVRMATLSLKYV